MTDPQLASLLFAGPFIILSFVFAAAIALGLEG
jgi:hypothetical protein